MRAPRLFVFACAFLAAGSRLGWAAEFAEPVEIRGPDLTLAAVLYRPEKPGPFPAVIALHGCEGLGEHTVERDRAWAKRLTDSGFVVLFPDSFGSRNLGPQCRNRTPTVRSSHERVADARLALRWLQEQNFIKPDRISLLGWANGGSTVLWAVRPRAGAAGSADDKPDYRSAVAFYPGCRRSLLTAWSARVPTLILIGSKDDWNAARPCQDMIDGTRGRSARADIVVYRGAHHWFDMPNQPLQELRGIASSMDGSGTVHVGTDTQARANALQRVPAWLAR